MTRGLYLVPTGTTTLLDDEPCGGRVPRLDLIDDETPHPECGCASYPCAHTPRIRSLALVHDGAVLPLAWWRAITTYKAAWPGAGSTWEVEGPAVERAEVLASDGERAGLWRVVRVPA